MLDSTRLKPITGTFVSPLLGDVGVLNWGREEWEADFRLMKSLGIDTVIVIRCETEQAGHFHSALDPRGTTWPDDPDLLSMFFRLCDEHGLDLYLGGVQHLTSLYLGEWEKEVAANRDFYERMLKRFGNRKCFKGLYLAAEALPWHFNFFDISAGILEMFHEVSPERKTLFSPTFYGLTGTMSSRYTPEEFARIYGAFFDRVKGRLDYCAWQDKLCWVDCRDGEILHSELDDWYAAAVDMMARNGVELWGNIESFQRSARDVPGSGRDYRQADYRTLIAKIESANRFAKKLVTFEFSTCLSPNAEWNSSGRLLRRYAEALGIAPEKIAWPKQNANAG